MFYRRLSFKGALSEVSIGYQGDLYSLRVIQDEVYHRTELGLKLIKRIFELGLR